MRVTTLLKRLVGIKNLLVKGFGEHLGALALDVEPSWRVPRCGRCGRKRSGTYDRRRERYWRHLDFGGIQVLLRYRPRRVNGPTCGVVVERVPWNQDVRSRYTEDFEAEVAYHVQKVDKTTVTRLFQIGWRTVGRIVERVVQRKWPDDALEGLEYMGVDELSYRKHHRYLTLVCDHLTNRIVWGTEGKSADSLVAFFKQLGEERCKQIKVVTMDMSAGYMKAARQYVPSAEIVFDRFHVEKMVRDALDKVRREEWHSLKGTDAAGNIKNLRWPLLKNKWNLTAMDLEKISNLQHRNARLYRAYLLKESFVGILDRRQPNVVRRLLEAWTSWASRSRLPSFVRVARTIKGHMDGIVAYIRCRLSNGLMEGLNNKARLITRRAYGFHSYTAALAMIMLCCSNLTLSPIHKSILLDPHQ